MKIYANISMLRDILGRLMILSIVFICLWLTMIPQSQGCNVPVFRYAVERWPADLYEVIIFYRGAMNSEEQALLEKLKYSSEANIYVSAFDISGKLDKKISELWKSQSEAELPWMVLLYPQIIQSNKPVWVSHFTDSAVDTLLHSPVRKKIVDSLLEGDSTVWLLMESGIKEKDEAIVNLLEANLKRMEESLEVPEQVDFEQYMGYELAEDIKIAFSVVRLARTDPQEQVLTQILFRNDPELETLEEPVAFPIFGRGRALCALMGDDIEEFNIEEISMFLTGPCSCQVKALNPGMDILLSANWDEMLGQQIAEYSEQPIVTSSTVPIALSNQGSGTLKRNIILAAFILVAFVILASSFLLLRRRKRAL